MPVNSKLGKNTFKAKVTKFRHNTNFIISHLQRKHQFNQFQRNFGFNNYNIIVGMGPTGLAHAIESINKGKKLRPVMLLSDRNKFTRPQILALRPDTVNYLKNLVNRDKVNDYLDREEMVVRKTPIGERALIQIKSLETLLHDHLVQLNYKINFKLIDKSSNAASLMPESNQIKLSNPYETFSFKYLIAADGARHDTFNNFLAEKVSYSSPQLIDQVNSLQSTVSYSLDNNLYKIIQESYQKPDKPTRINEFRSFGWNLYSAPENRIFFVNKTLYIGTEFPKYTTINKNSIDEWARLILKTSFPSYIVNQLYESNLKHEYTTFDIQLKEANRYIFAINSNTSTKDSYRDNRSYIIGTGDAVKLPHYHTGSGAQLGLDQAKIFGEFLSTYQGLPDVANYENKLNKIIVNNRHLINNFLINRLQRENEAKRIALLEEKDMRRFKTR